MCTALRWKDEDCYFGRNLDLNCSFGETVAFVPRNFPLQFRRLPAASSHFAILGMASVVDGVPLYADAFNEKGLAGAGLNFPGNAAYFPYAEGKNNLASFEFLSYVLSRFDSVQAARPFLENVSFLDEPFRPNLPLAPLHFILADRTQAIVVEPTRDGAKVYDDPYDVLTNNPPFPFHERNLALYRNLSAKEKGTDFLPGVDLKSDAVGFGAIGLPGDYSSASRFVRAAFVLKNTPSQKDEIQRLNAFFHALDAVRFPTGSVLNPDGTTEETIYSSCMNLDKKTYSYVTKEDRAVRRVAMDPSKMEDREIRTWILDRKASLLDIA